MELDGIGNVQPQTFGELAQHVKQVFGLDSLRLVHYQERDLQKPISRVAICGGSGQSFYNDALAKGADVYITGDIYYHTAQDMLSDGLLALDPGHYIEGAVCRKNRSTSYSMEGRKGLGY